MHDYDYFSPSQFRRNNHIRPFLIASGIVVVIISWMFFKPSSAKNKPLTKPAPTKTATARNNQKMQSDTHTPVTQMTGKMSYGDSKDAAERSKITKPETQAGPPHVIINEKGYTITGRSISEPPPDWNENVYKAKAAELADQEIDRVNAKYESNTLYTTPGEEVKTLRDARIETEEKTRREAEYRNKPNYLTGGRRIVHHSTRKESQ